MPHAPEEKLNVVDENDRVIGQETRTAIHTRGLWHREVGIWIYNGAGELLLQRRAPDKDIAPNLLDTSAGGHVGIGETYEQAALKELAEETGIRARPEELVRIAQNKRFSGPQPNGMLNKAMRVLFAYRFKDGVDTVQFEHGKATSLEWWPMEKIGRLNELEQKQFSGFVIKDYPDVSKAVRKLLAS
ncbi:MAG: NUDIX domain-containing protein [Patescibacteria group bacterium]|nr:NUDIX domain-containing protein [Patescibacteria group bacterium]